MGAGASRQAQAPLPQEEALAEELVKGPSIASLPDFPELAERIEAPALLKVGGDVSTDEISPAGARRCRSARTFPSSPSSFSPRSAWITCAGPRSSPTAAVISWSAATTTVRAPPENTPWSPLATWVCTL
jgi:hypothetical protein